MSVFTVSVYLSSEMGGENTIGKKKIKKERQEWLMEKNTKGGK